MKKVLYELAAGPRIAVNIALCQAVGGLIPGAMLSQAMYWCRKKPEFWKTDAEWQAELTVSKRQVQKARQKLVDMELLTVEKRGVPCRNFYRVNEEKLVSLMCFELPGDKGEDELSTGNGSTGRHDAGQPVDTGRVKWLTRGGSTNQRLPSKITPKKIAAARQLADGEKLSAEEIMVAYDGKPPDPGTVDQVFKDAWHLAKSGTTLAGTSKKRSAILTRVAKRWGDEWLPVMLYTLQHWGDVVHLASRELRNVNPKSYPVPTPERITTLADACVTMYRRHVARQQEYDPETPDDSGAWDAGLKDDF